MLALVCLGLLVIAALAAPLHKHDAQDGATCLICHVTQRASVASVAPDAGVPNVAAEREVVCRITAWARTEAPDTVRTPRAPPLNFFSV